jgi:plastocyanin
MNKLLLTTALTILAVPAFAKEYIITASGMSFEPANLTIQPGDTVTFVDEENKKHDVMFVNVPKGVNEMIMSPMMKTKGDKFSYTFNVPGTYQYHCHPHEELGMKGTLIVGQASKPGETVAMDHHKMAISLATGSVPAAAKIAPAEGPAATSNLPEGTGQVNSVDAAGHTINITHDPIKALGWPKMKMQFSVASDVDLNGVKAGDSVSFTLKPKGEDDYEVVSIHNHTH